MQTIGRNFPKTFVPRAFRTETLNKLRRFAREFSFSRRKQQQTFAYSARSKHSNSSFPCKFYEMDKRVTFMQIWSRFVLCTRLEEFRTVDFSGPDPMATNSKENGVTVVATNDQKLKTQEDRVNRGTRGMRTLGQNGEERVRNAGSEWKEKLKYRAKAEQRASAIPW